MSQWCDCWKNCNTTCRWKSVPLAPLSFITQHVWIHGRSSSHWLQCPFNPFFHSRRIPSCEYNHLVYTKSIYIYIYIFVWLTHTRVSLYRRAKSQKLLSVKHARKPPAFWERRMTVSSSLLDPAPSMTLKLPRNTASWMAILFFFVGLRVAGWLNR